MKDSRLSRQLPASLGLLLTLTLLSMAGICALSLQTMSTVLDSQTSHSQSFVPAKRIASDFERQILNARISFIYVVTIQKPGSYDSGWDRYHAAEIRLAEMSAQVAAHPELSDLSAPVTKLHADLDAYHVALHTDDANGPRGRTARASL